MIIFKKKWQMLLAMALLWLFFGYQGVMAEECAPGQVSCNGGCGICSGPRDSYGDCIPDMLSLIHI